MKDHRAIPKHTLISGPDGQAYQATREIDVTHGYALMYGDFEPIGGAPEPRIGDVAPDWLNNALISLVAGKELSEGIGG